jgi:hypothetical protein
MHFQGAYRETDQRSSKRRLDSETVYMAVRKKEPPAFDYDGIWDIIWRGAMPQLYAEPAFPLPAFYASYLRTYIERDVRAIINVGDEKNSSPSFGAPQPGRDKY